MFCMIINDFQNVFAVGMFLLNKTVNYVYISPHPILKCLKKSIWERCSEILSCTFLTTIKKL